MASFPDDYSNNPDLAGKDVYILPLQFNYINGETQLPETER